MLSLIIIAIIIAMPSVLSKPIFTYHQKDRPQEYPTKSYMLYDRVADGEDEVKGGHCNKTQHEVLKNGGDPRYISTRWIE